jgi:hypothetical protein
MWIFFLCLLFPPSYAKPQFAFSADTLVVTLNTQNPSQMAKLVCGKVEDPLDFHFERYQISKTPGNLHTFKITGISENQHYIFKAAYFDTITKVYYATQNYFFKPKRIGNKLEEGIVIDAGPYLSLPAQNRVGISLYTNRPSRAVLRIKNLIEIEDTVLKERHEFSVSIMKPGIYEYSVTVYDDRDTSTGFLYTFRISNGKKLRIGVFGDTRGNPNSLNPEFYVDGVNEEIGRRVLKALFDEKVDIIFVTGDLITGRMQNIEYAEEEYKSFIKACWPYISYVPVMPVPGNHDMIAPVMENEEMRYDPPPPNSAENLWAKVFTLPENGPESPQGMPPYVENVYFLRIGDFVIYALNSDYNYTLYKKLPNPSIRLPDTLQRKWLREKIRENSCAKHMILLFHEPLIGLGISERGIRSPEVDTFANFIKNLGFRYYISCHDHMYARGKIFNGLTQIVSAGGGAPLYDLKKELLDSRDIVIEKYVKTFNYLVIEPVDRKRLRITAKSLSGRILDVFETK